VITTLSPLFGGSVGAAYSQPFTATGGTPPYSWSLQTQLPGLTLDPQTGSLAGTPREPGSFVLIVTVRDREGGVASGEFPLRIEQPELRITSGSPLPPATAGVHYQQRFIASGGRPPYTWSMGGFVPGLSLDAASGVMSGTPTEAGGFEVFLSIRDDAGSAVTRAYRLIVGGGALRLSAIPEPVGTMAGEPLSLLLTASGGVPPYSWAANGLPEGISLTDTGEITGAVRTPGVYLFTVRLTDTARTSVTQAYRLDAAAPALPDIQISGVGDAANAADQIPLELKIASGYRLPMSGELLLSFAADTGSGDPAVQFVTGGRAVPFQVAAGATHFEMAGPVSLQTGTVAGTIVLSLRLQTAGANLTPVPVTLQRIRIERSAPVVVSASITRTESALEIALTGYSTAREITECVFRFRSSGAAPLQSSEVTLAVEEAFGRWFRSAESAAYGGQFTFTQPFAVQGDPALVIPVSVTLRNRTGSTTYQVP
jgi:hypothetical protein